MPVCRLLALVSVLQLAAMRSRGRGEAARAAALATAGGPFEPTEQQLQLQRVSGVTAQPAMHAMLLSNNSYRTSWLPSLPSRLQHHITLESCTMVPGLRQHHTPLLCVGLRLRVDDTSKSVNFVRHTARFVFSNV